MHGCRSARAIRKIATSWLSAASQLLLLISWRSSHASTLAAFRASTKSALLDAWLNWCLKMYNDVVAHVYYGAFLGEGGQVDGIELCSFIDALIRHGHQ